MLLLCLFVPAREACACAGAVLAACAIMKLFEGTDHAVFQAGGGLLSGHTLKHLAAALAAWPVISALAALPGTGECADGSTGGLNGRRGWTTCRRSRCRPRLSRRSPTSSLLRQRRFAPFFWTQFAGAANDNLFKFAFTVMVTYQLQVRWLPPALANLVIGALFILPFLLFSATSGQLADKYDKRDLIRFVKWLEVGIMGLAAVGFFGADVPILLACTFLMGLHSTLFGPVKFAYLPQHLGERELTGGNGWWRWAPSSPSCWATSRAACSLTIPSRCAVGGGELHRDRPGWSGWWRNGSPLPRPVTRA